MWDNLSLLIQVPVLNVQLLLDGLFVGAIFALMAYGLALVWGVMNIKNLAQGDFVMMGGAFAGVADDFTAMYWNPAGLAQMSNREIRVSFLRNGRETKSTFNGTPGFSDLSNTRFGSMGFVYPFPVYQGSLVLAAGFTRIKDYDWSLNLKGTDQGLAGDHNFQHEGELALAGVAAAVDMSPAISLGATLGLVSGEDQAVNEFNWTDPQDEFFERRFLARDTFAELKSGLK